MAVVFSGERGRVVVLSDPATAATARTVTLDGFSGFQVFRSIITSITIGKQSNCQFMHTLGGNIFVYVFGDRVGMVRLGGLAFAGSCTGNENIGLERMLAYYEQNKIGNRERPLTITLGAATTLVCYLVGMEASMEDAQNRIYNFDMQLALIPEPSL